MKTNAIKERFSNDYKAGKLSKPTRMEYSSPDELRDLCLAWARYVYGSYCLNETMLTWGGFSRFTGRSLRELRMYGRGANGPEKYQKLLDASDQAGEGYYNISWDTVKIYSSKFRNIVRGMMDSMKFDFQTNAIDDTARKERELTKNKMKLQVNPRMRQLLESTGKMPSTPAGFTTQDVDILYKLGGQRLGYEILMQAALLSTMYESGWEEVIRGMLVDDIIDCGVAATDTYLERATGKIKVKYVDPEQIVARASKYPDGRDRDFAGYFEDMSLSDLRMQSGLDEREIYLIAKKYAGAMGNEGLMEPFRDQFSSRSFREEYFSSKGYQVYDNFRVQVLNLYFISNEVEKYIMGTHPDGNLIYDPVQPGASLDKRDVKRGKSLQQKTVQNVYTTKWVVGTDYIFDHALEYGIARQGEPGNKRAVLPMKIWMYDGPSITEACVGYIDDINMATYKKRNAMAKLPPGPRIIIDKSKLRDTVIIGKETFSILDLVGIGQSTGVFIIESKGEFDLPGQASQGHPYNFMPTGIVEDLQIFLQEIVSSIEGLRSVTGINEVADGSLNREILVGVASGLQSATNNALRPHLGVYESLFKENCKYWMLKWQVALLNGDVEVKYTPIGEDTVLAAKLTKELMDYEFGITLEILPNDEEKILLLRHLFELWTKGGMRADDYFIAADMVKGNKMKAAKLFISKAVDAREKEIEANAMKRIQANAESNAISATATERAKSEGLMAQLSLEKELVQVKELSEIRVMREEFRLKMLEKGYDQEKQIVAQQ